MKRLQGTVAIVTGAGQGLGQAFARGLSREGADVVVADLAGERARAVAQNLPGEGRATAVTVDVTDEAQVAAMVDTIVEEHGRIDLLVNNAAVFASLRMGPFEEITLEEWEQVMAVNVRGTWLCCRAVAPVMTEQGSGKIVNVSSGTMFIGRANYLHYVTSKAAVYGMTRSLATELGARGVTVNTLMPGSTQTEVRRDTVTAEQHEAIIASRALKRAQEPEDTVGALLFLASPESDFVTGQTLNVDGGAAYH